VLGGASVNLGKEPIANHLRAAHLRHRRQMPMRVSKSASPRFVSSCWTVV